MSNEQKVPVTPASAHYELRFLLARIDGLTCSSKVFCEDIITIDFEPHTGNSFVFNLEGPDRWHGEDEDKLEAVLKYLKARLS